jgi:hypothetical protein
MGDQMAQHAAEARVMPRLGLAAQALIICCVDYRYIQAIQRFVRRRFNVTRYGLKTDAGGTRALLRGPRAVRAWIWRNLTLAYERQGVRRFFLFHHRDCLLYGGSSAFAGQGQEAAAHRRDLRRCRALLTRRFPDVHVAAFYASDTARGITFKAISG